MVGSLEKNPYISRINVQRINYQTNRDDLVVKHEAINTATAKLQIIYTYTCVALIYFRRLVIK